MPCLLKQCSACVTWQISPVNFEKNSSYPGPQNRTAFLFRNFTFMGANNIGQLTDFTTIISLC